LRQRSNLDSSAIKNWSTRGVSVFVGVFMIPPLEIADLH